MKKNQVAEVLKSYELGVEAEKHQLMLFQDVEYEEKNEVADYLISKQKLNRHPSSHESAPVLQKSIALAPSL